MYLYDDRLRPPEDRGATIWRFMDFPKFMSMLTEPSLYFTRADRFEDPFEGTFGVSPHGTKITPWFGLSMSELGSGGGMIARSADEEEQRLVDEVDRLRKRMFVNCWHVNEHAPASMWAQYARQGVGVAVKSTVGRLISAVERTDREIRISEVVYGDDQGATAHEEYPLARFIRKRMAFEHERELRAILEEESQIGWREMVVATVAVDLQQLVTELRISPGAPRWFGGLVVRVCRQFKLDVPTRRSTLDDRPLY